MTQYERDLSNLSYTNKDFGKIYPELLDLVKKISYKWDPSQSDESDPGVVLLKLAALMADKNNYNIDKNILETFPLSVTQLQNARQLFEQCGYYMKYYRSATTNLSMTLVKGCEPDISENDIAQLSPNDPAIDIEESQNTRSYIIPKYTMVSDLENSVVYTLTQDVTLRSDGVTVDNIPALQGVINTYTINGESVITAANLDYNNRLYFTEFDIAENGIFIEGELNREWEKVDNLVLQPLGSCCYKFNVTEDGSSCYIEFPSDIDTLIGNGITIHYLRTRGAEGNVGRKRLHQFYTDVTATRYIDSQYTQDVTLTTYESTERGNVYITNSDAAIDGKNPETIDEAYRNYQKIKTTFETLVSLRDYENFLYTNKNVSNCFVCDRTNDIQSAYKIVDSDNTYSTTVSAIHKNENDDPEMTAFDLRVYGLSYVEDPTTTEGFNKSFNVINQRADTVTEWLEILMDTDDIKTIQHNYKQFEPERIIMLMNRYPIISRIIPQYKLETKQQEEVVKTIVASLYKVLNSRAIDFGSPIEYDVVYDTIMNADPRIKAITLEDITYTTYAVYRGQDDEIHEIRIDTLSVEPEDEKEAELWNKFRREIYAKSVLAGKTQLLKPDTRFQYGLSHTDSDLILNGYRLTTNTNIIAARQGIESSTEYLTAQLKTNENIVFTAPNMIEDVPYSSYVKFLHNIGFTGSRPDSSVSLTDKDTVVTANDDYTLKPTEYIVFFWKTEEDEYAPYQYIKYTGEEGAKIKVISPTFRMLKQRQPDNRMLPHIPEDIIASLPTGKKSTTDKVHQSVNGTVKKSDVDVPVTMTFTEYISGIMGSEFVLTGSNTITTKKPNIIHINNTENGTNNVYWVLNEVKDSMCTLFNDGETTYILKTGEYFIYSNDAKTQLHMLGSGTKITRTPGGVAWACPSIDYDKFLSEGVHYLDGQWFTIPSDFKVEATEMQFYQIGPSNTIRLIYDETVALPEGASHPDKIIFNNTKTVTGDGKDWSLYPYRISYIDNSNVETFLPRRNTVDTTWQAYSILNLNVSSEKSQHLDANQSIVVKDKDGNETRLPKMVEGKTDGATILTNRTVSLTGGVDLDCTVVDLVNNSVLPLEIYSFELNANFITENTDDPRGYGEWSFDSHNSILTIQIGSSVQALNFTLPVGKYIMPIFVDSNFDVLRFDATSGGKTTQLKTVSGSSSYATAGTHYIELQVSGSQSDSTIGACELKVTSTLNGTIPSSITFNKLFKYTVPNLEEVNDGEQEYKISDFTAMDIANLIDTELDTQHIFNYTYVVPDEDIVRNPLVASSFMDTNHIFNPFTICRWDTSSELNKLAIITKIK